jgi:hypothetical protein
VDGVEIPPITATNQWDASRRMELAIMTRLVHQIPGVEEQVRVGSADRALEPVPQMNVAHLRGIGMYSRFP